jgi:hypothetical protein
VAARARSLQSAPCNNIHPNGLAWGSEVFLHKLIEFTGLEQKIVLFARTGFRLNSVKRSARMRHLERWSDHITSIVRCPRIFSRRPVSHENSQFNMPSLNPRDSQHRSLASADFETFLGRCDRAIDHCVDGRAAGSDIFGAVKCGTFGFTFCLT